MPGPKEGKSKRGPVSLAEDPLDLYSESDAWLTAFPTTTEFFHYFSQKLKGFEKQNQKAMDFLEV